MDGRLMEFLCNNGLTILLAIVAFLIWILVAATMSSEEDC